MDLKVSPSTHSLYFLNFEPSKSSLISYSGVNYFVYISAGCKTVTNFAYTVCTSFLLDTYWSRMQAIQITALRIAAGYHSVTSKDRHIAILML